MLLNVHSYYSLRYGTLSLEQIVQDMMQFGYDTAVLMDINNSSAVLDFIRLTRDQGLNGLAGMEFRNGNELMYGGIAKNQRGFKELNELMTSANRENSLLLMTALNLTTYLSFILMEKEVLASSGIMSLSVSGLMNSIRYVQSL